MAASVKPSPGRKSDKLMRDAISVALHRTQEVNGETLKNIYRVAAKLVDKAIDGDIAAIKEVNDRMDGKAHQAVTVDGALDVEVSLATDLERAKAVAALVAAAQRGEK